MCHLLYCFGLSPKEHAVSFLEAIALYILFIKTLQFVVLHVQRAGCTHNTPLSKLGQTLSSKFAQTTALHSSALKQDSKSLANWTCLVSLMLRFNGVTSTRHL